MEPAPSKQREKEQLKLLIKLCNRIAKSSKSVNPACGVCGNLGHFVHLPYHEMGNLAIAWKHYSGEFNYPIPGGRQGYSKHQSKGTLWVGKQGTYRRSLARYWAKQLTAKYKHILT